MTDVVKLANSGTTINNGSSVITAYNTGRYQNIVPTINNQTHVSGVAGATDNGYLDNRFRAS